MARAREPRGAHRGLRAMAREGGCATEDNRMRRAESAGPGTKRVGIVGGGIAGDFPICVVPLITQDLERKVPVWAYFCQISDSTTSYGGYSGAVPNEKITWGKLSAATPKFIIESDATIVAPLIFACVLGH